MPASVPPLKSRRQPTRSLAVRLRGVLDRYRPGGVPLGRPAPDRPALPGDAGSRSLGLARAALWWEALWPALWRPLSLLGLFLAAAWAGLFIHLSLWLHLPLLLAVLGGIGWLSWLGFKGLRVPSDEEARRRLERDSQLSHRPLAQLQDGIAGGAGDALSHALWRLAQERARVQAADLRLDLPDSRLPARDPWALRVAALLLMVVGATIGWGDLGGRTAGALFPSAGIGGILAPTRLEAWATPPDYTGQPPVFLTGPPVPADFPH